MGFFCVGPSLYYWYNFLWKMIPGNSISIALKRLFFDQLCYSPFSCALFLTVPFLLEGKGKDIPTIIRSNYLSTLCGSICTWTPANFITFKFIPLKYTVFNNIYRYYLLIVYHYFGIVLLHGKAMLQKKIINILF